MALVLDWLKAYGFRNDPFIDTAFFGEHVCGLETERERLNLFIIKKERLGVIAGESGSGKTTLLLWLRKELRDTSVAVHLYDAKMVSSKEKLVSALAADCLNLLDKLTQKDEEDAVREKLAKETHLLLIDNATSLTSAEETFLEKLLETTALQILLADTFERLKKLALAKKAVTIELAPLVREAIVELLRVRIESVGGKGTAPFNDHHIEELRQDAKSNPRELLRRARERAIELAVKPAEKRGVKIFNVRFEEEDPAEAMQAMEHLAEKVMKTPSLAREPGPHVDKQDVDALSKLVSGEHVVVAIDEPARDEIVTQKMVLEVAHEVEKKAHSSSGKAKPHAKARKR